MEKRSNKRILVGTQFPTKFNNLENDFIFDGKTAFSDSILDITKRIKKPHKSNKKVRTQHKIEALYNAIDKNIQFSENENKRKNSGTKKSNSKKYSRR